VRSTLDGRFLDCNAAYASMVGYTREELLGIPVPAIYVDPDERRRLLRALTPGEPEAFELELRARDGRILCAIGVTELAEDPVEGTVIETRIIDVTARRLAEAESRRQLLDRAATQDREGMGRLMGGIAHDFNNLLTAILGFAELAHDGLPAGDPLRADISEISRAGQAAASLVGQLLATSGRQILFPKALDLNDMVQRLAPAWRQTVGDGIELVTRLEAPASRVSADPKRLEEALTELVVNASAAMTQGGRLTVATAVERGGVSLSVNDTGAGIAQADLPHLFEPFFKSTSTRRGRGMGLAVVKGFVTQSGGTIDVTSAHGEGATFTLWLPASTAPLGCAALSPFAAGVPKRILLIEDIPELRRFTQAVLERHGYRVHAVASTVEALSALGDESDVDLVLSGARVAGRGARQLTDALAARRPPVPVVFMAGLLADAVVDSDGLTHRPAFLRKPFTPAELLQTIRRSLASA
jgi:PAS domain S-box-containing protein